MDAEVTELGEELVAPPANLSTSLLAETILIAAFSIPSMRLYILHIALLYVKPTHMEPRLSQAARQSLAEFDEVELAPISMSWPMYT